MASFLPYINQRNFSGLQLQKTGQQKRVSNESFSIIPAQKSPSQ